MTSLIETIAPVLYENIQLSQDFFQDINSLRYRIIKETDSELVMSFWVPGYKNEEIDIFTEDNELYIEAEKKRKSNNYQGFDRFSFSYLCSQKLSFKDAIYQNGILKVFLNKEKTNS